MKRKAGNYSPNWGGARPNAGRPPSGVEKLKKSVSVSAEVWHEAMGFWDRKPASQLIEKLLEEYVERERSKEAQL